MCKKEFYHVRDRLDEEKLLSSNLKKEVRRLKEDDVTDLKEQIRDANAELRTAKERTRVLEEELLAQEQKFNGIILTLQNKLNGQGQSNQIAMKKLEKDHEHVIQTMREQVSDEAELTAEAPTFNRKKGFSGRIYTT